jgi:PUA domain protein
MAVSKTAVKRYFLKEKATRQLLLELSQKFKVDTEQLFGPKPHIELAETQVAEILFINRKPLFARVDENILPTLIFNDVFPLLLMVPGVVQINGDFNTDDFVLVVDERHGKPLAIGVALFDSHAMRKMKRGKIVRNIHYVGDRLWKALKKI